MSKERLEEILSDFRQLLALGRVTMDILNKAEKIHEIIIQQAERVQELECLEMQARMEKHKYNKQNKRYQEAIDDIKNVWKVTDTYQEYMGTVHDIIKDLEGEE